MKKVVRIALLAILAVTVTGCGSKAEDKDQVQRYAWPLGTSSPEDTVTQIYAEKFAQEVNRLSDGTMIIEVYPNSVIGGDRELLESCTEGDIPFVVQNTAPQVSFIPEVAVFDLPCAFQTITEVREAVDDEEFYAQIGEIYQKSGYRLLGFADQGFRVMSSNKEITSLKDFKGQKVRTMENSNHIKFWKLIGANPTPMTFSEVYIGLQQNTINAQENPYEVIVSGKLYEQQDYVIETNHLPHLLSLIVSEEFYQGLTKEQQHIIDVAAETAKEYAREQSDERIADRIEIIEESGTKIVSLSDDTLGQIRTAVEPLYKEIREQVGDLLVDSYLN